MAFTNLTWSAAYLSSTARVGICLDIRLNGVKRVLNVFDEAETDLVSARWVQDSCAREALSEKSMITVRKVTVGGTEVELLPPLPYAVRYVVERGSIGFAFDPQIGEHAIGCDRRSQFDVRAGSLAWLPAGCDVYSASDFGGEYMRVVPAEDEFCAETCLTNAIDREAWKLAVELRRIVLTNGEVSHFEILVASLVERLRSHLDGVVKRPAGWMTHNRLRRIEKMIDDRLTESLTVAELARSLGLCSATISSIVRLSIIVLGPIATFYLISPVLKPHIEPRRSALMPGPPFRC